MMMMQKFIHIWGHLTFGEVSIARRTNWLMIIICEWIDLLFVCHVVANMVDNRVCVYNGVIFFNSLDWSCYCVAVGRFIVVRDTSYDFSKLFVRGIEQFWVRWYVWILHKHKDCVLKITQTITFIFHILALIWYICVF
jgi:hypothetical protein